MKTPRSSQQSLFTALVDEATVNREIETTQLRSFSVKYAALGLVAGAFIVIMIICLKYVLSQTIKTKEDMSELFKVNVLGRMKENADGELGMIVASSGLGAQKAELKKIYAISSTDNAIVSAITDKVVEAIKQNYSELNVESGKSVLTDPSSLAKLAESNGVILIEKLRTSKFEDIAKELELAKNYGVTVLGCVIVE